MLRRPLLLLAVMLVFPSVLLAASEPLTGTIEVSRVNGKVAVQGKSVVWGKLAKGSITAYGTSGAGVPSVSGPNLKVKMVRTGNRQAVVYSGAGIRFMFPRADHNLGFEGAGIDFSAVGKGTLQASGRGVVAVNGSKQIYLGQRSVPLVVMFGKGAASQRG